MTNPLEPTQDIEGICPSCDGDGKEHCNNPDHNFIAAIGGEIGRLGCPTCRFPESTLVEGGGNCEHCGGTKVTGQLETDSQQVTEPVEIAPATPITNDIDTNSELPLSRPVENNTQLDELKARAEKMLYDLFYKGMEAGEDITLQYQFEQDPPYKYRYADRCIKSAKNELADILLAWNKATVIEELKKIVKNNNPRPNIEYDLRSNQYITDRIAALQNKQEEK